MKTLRLSVLAVVLVIAASVGMSGCSIFRGACSSALPVLSVVQTYVHEAGTRVDQAESALSVVDLGPAVRNNVAQAISKARDGLTAADKLIRAASGACESIDPVTTMADFVDAWKAIENLLAMHSTQLGAAPGVPSVLTPSIVLEARQRGVK